MASPTIQAAPFPTRPSPDLRRISAATGAACGVLIVVASGDRPRPSSTRPAILACPKLAPSGLRTGEHAGPFGQTDQVSPGHRGQLQTLAVGGLVQELAHRGRRVHLVDDPRGPTAADHLQRVDAVRAGDHPRHDGRHLACQVHSRRGHPSRASATRSATDSDSPACSANAFTGTRPSIRHEVLLIQERGSSSRGPCLRSFRCQCLVGAKRSGHRHSRLFSAT